MQPVTCMKAVTKALRHPEAPGMGKYANSPRKKPGLFAQDNPLRILVADDDLVNRRVMLLFLKYLGYEAYSVEDGLQCFNEARKNKYDLILMDLEMPKMNGIECAYSLRQAGIESLIIGMTAGYPITTPQQCFEAGMNGYLEKPLGADKLRETIREVSGALKAGLPRMVVHN